MDLFYVLGGQNHRPARGLVLWAAVPGYKGFLYMAEAQQEGELFLDFLCQDFSTLLLC